MVLYLVNSQKVGGPWPTWPTRQRGPWVFGYSGFQSFVENVPKIHKKAKILALFKRKNLKKDLRINFSLLKAKKVGKIVL